MIKQTHIIDKDAVLEDSIDTLQQKLLIAGFNIVELSWINPVASIWSVTLSDNDCPLLFSSGQGVSKKTALADALGEFYERLTTHYFWSCCYFGDEVANCKYIHHPNEKWFQTIANNSWPDGVLDGPLGRGLRDFYNPEGELNPNTLIDMNSANPKRGICCIPFQSVHNKEIINLPVNIINNLYSSNGISSGNTAEVAYVNALSEIIEHYIQFKIISEGISLPDIPKEVLNRYPIVKECIQAFKEKGCSLLIQDASLNGKYPVIACTFLDSENQSVYSCFGAHPKFESALQRSLSKLFYTQCSDSTGVFSEAGFDMDEISSPNNLEKHFINMDQNALLPGVTKSNPSSGIVAWKFLNDKAGYEFVDWNTRDSVSNTAEEFKYLCDLIHAQGNDIFISDYKEIGIDACRIIVPGMSEIYPIDDLVLENNNVGMGVRCQILKTVKTLEDCESLIQVLEDLNQDDEYLVSALVGMPSDTDSIFHDMCIAELITLLALRTQDNERIQEGCEWLLHFQQINPRRLKTYQCINTILQLDSMTEYATALEKLYTRPILNDALALIAGEDVFPLISDWNQHKLLIEGYKKMVETEI